MDLLNLIFIFLSLIAIAALCFYFYRLAQHDKEEWLKKEIKFATEEKEAEEWLHTTFLPDVLRFIEKHPKMIIKYTFFVLLAGISLWSYLAEGLQGAAINDFFYCVIYVFTILYIYWEPKFFSYAKNHLPRKIRHSFDNDWMRAYIFFLPPTCIIYIFLPKPLSFLSYFLVYSALFLCLLAATRLSEDIGKDDEKQRKKVLKKLLEE